MYRPEHGARSEGELGPRLQQRRLGLTQCAPLSPLPAAASAGPLPAPLGGAGAGRGRLNGTLPHWGCLGHTVGNT